ncbi:hypothetical protein [Rummeliibacillus suwonensis]|uniref:hypothetical protein n=1 Tax=Rummeliibacillus suwonensis TaxID=1306154 RepID=UPI0011B624ED|nr:hypothetical protein [Rummeliibacillus suwonensis]
MEYLYIDEKGTQETIKALGNNKTPYTDEQKIELGTDNMKDFIATVVKISDVHLENVEYRYSNLEEEYKAKSQKFKNGKGELKGSDILKKNFKNGIASLNKRGLKFYVDLVDILIENKVENHVFVVNKIGLVIDKRFTDWILKLGERGYLPSIYRFKYSLIKYVENEANKEVIQALFNKDTSSGSVLNLILSDIKAFIRKHKKIRYRDRLDAQLKSYKELKILIENYKIYLTDEDFKNESDKFIRLNWEKAVFSIDLWLIELNIDRGEIELSLDDGIKKTPFDRLKLAKIHEGLDSKNHVGLRIADVLIVLIGNCISKLTLDMKYDKSCFLQAKSAENCREIYIGLQLFFYIKSQYPFLRRIRHFSTGSFPL